MTTERDVPAAIATFEGRHWLLWAAHPATLIALAVAATIAASLLSPLLPWPSALGGGGLAGLGLVVALGSCALGVALNRWARARAGRAELFDRRLVVQHEGQLLHVDLAEVCSFDDRSADFVRITLERPEWLPPRLVFTVPTPVDPARAALVSALAAAGAPRDDGQPLPPRDVRADTTILRVHGDRRLVVGLIWLGFLATFLAIGLIDLGSTINRTLHAAGLLLAVAVPIVASVWARPRTGTVWFMHDLIVLNPMHVSAPPGWRCVVAWDDVIGWRSTSSAYLRLVLRPGLVRDTYGSPTVPTATPEDRAAVEALLATRAVPRL